MKFSNLSVFKVVVFTGAFALFLSVTLAVLFPFNIVLFPIVVMLTFWMFGSITLSIFKVVKLTIDVIKATIVKSENRSNTGTNEIITIDNVEYKEVKQVDEYTQSNVLHVQTNECQITSERLANLNIRSVSEDDLSYLETPAYLRNSDKIIY